MKVTRTRAVLGSLRRIAWALLAPAVLLLTVYLMIFLTLNSRQGSDWLSAALTRVLPGTLHYAHLRIGASLARIDLFEATVDDENGRRVVEVAHLACDVRRTPLLLGRLEFADCRAERGRMLVEPYPPQGEVGFLTAFGGAWSGKERNDTLELLFDGVELVDVDVIVSLDDMLLRFDSVSVTGGRIEAIGKDLRMDAHATIGGGRLFFNERLFNLGDGAPDRASAAWDLLRRVRPWQASQAPIVARPEGGGWLDLPIEGGEVLGFSWRDNAFRVDALRVHGPGIGVDASGWIRLVPDDPKRLAPNDAGIFFDGRAAIRVPPTSPILDYFLPGLVQARPGAFVDDLVFDGVGNVSYFDGGRTRLAFGHLALLGWEIPGFEADVSFEEDLIVLHPGARLQIWDGVISGSGALRTTDGVWELGLCVDRIRADALVTPFVDAPVGAFDGLTLSSNPAYCMPGGPTGMRLTGDLSLKAFELAPAFTTPEGKELMPPFLTVRADGLRAQWPRAPSFLLARDMTIDLRATLDPRGTLRLRRLDGSPGLRVQSTGLRAELAGGWSIPRGEFTSTRVNVSVLDVHRWAERAGIEGVPDRTTGSLELRFAGPGDDPDIDLIRAELRRTVSDVDFPEFVVRLLGRVRGDDLELDRVEVESSVATASASGRVGLFDGTIFASRRDPTLALGVRVDRLRLGAFGLRLGPSAQVEGAFRLSGTVARPQLRGERLEATQLQLGGEPIERIAAGPFEADRRALQIQNLEVVKGAGLITGNLAWSFEDDHVDLRVRGRRLRLEDIRVVSDLDVDLRGRLRFDVAVRGPIADLDVEGSIIGENIRWQRIPLGGLGLAFDTWDGAVHLTGGLAGDLGVRIRAPLDGSPLELGLELSDFDLRDYLADLREAVTSSALGGRIDLQIDWSRGGRITGSATLDTIALQLGARSFSVARPASFRFATGEGADGKGSVFVVNQLALTTSGREAVLRGALRTSGVEGDAPVVSFSLGGDVDLSLLRFLPSLVADAEGNTNVSLKLNGPVNAPQLQGELNLGVARVAPRGLGTSIFLRPGRIRVTTDALVIDEAEPLLGSIYNGDFRLHGRVGLAGLLPASADMHVFISNLQYRIPEELNLTLAGTLRYEAPDLADAFTWRLSGDIDLVDARYYKRFDLLGGGLALGGLGRQVDAFAVPLWQAVPEFGAMQANLRVVGRDRFRVQPSVSNVQFDVEFRTELDITGRFAAMEVVGEMEALEGGRIIFRGRPFDVRRLFISFRGDRDNQGFPMPWLDAELLASIRPCVRRQRDTFALLDAAQTGITEVPNVLLTAWVDGRFPDQVDFRLESTPFYDQRDQLSLVLTGCTVDELTASSAGAPTLDIVLRPVIEAVEQSVEERFNVDSVDLIPTTDGTAGIQIIDELSVRFRWALDAIVGQGSTTRQSMRGEYRIFDWLIVEVQEQSSSEENLRLDTGFRFRIMID